MSADLRSAHVGGARRSESLACGGWRDAAGARDEKGKPVLDGEGREQPLLLDPSWPAPVLSHGLLYLRGRDRLVCLEVIPEKK